MSFHPARLATEKAVSRTALPSVFLPGIAGMHMNHEVHFSDGVVAKVYMADEPMVELSNILGLPGRHCYFGRQFIEALTDNGFSVSPSFDDQYPYTLSLTDLQSVVNAVRKLITDRKDGHYALTWVSTKGLPF